MFTSLKKKSLRKVVAKSKLIGVTPGFNYQINTVGIVTDKAHVSEVTSLIDTLKEKGVDQKAISVVVYDPKTQKDLTFQSYSMRDFDMNGNCSNTALTEFVQKTFDVLISFYESESPALLWVTAQSKSMIKVGVTSTYLTMNHFSIDMAPLTGKQYVQYLYEYFTIFKK